jgi:hypothetical protein
LVQDCKSWPTAIAEALPKRKIKKDEEAEEDDDIRNESLHGNDSSVKSENDGGGDTN